MSRGTHLASDWGPFHSAPDVVLGERRGLWYYGWHPDRELNPQYAHLPDVERYGANLSHPRADGSGECFSGVTFDGPVQRELEKPPRPIWQVVSWDPLTLSPSLLCRTCGDHGFVREGRWVPA